MIIILVPTAAISAAELAALRYHSTELVIVEFKQALQEFQLTQSPMVLNLVALLEIPRDYQRVTNTRQRNLPATTLNYDRWIHLQWKPPKIARSIFTNFPLREN